MVIEDIDSLDDSRLDVYRDLKTRNVVRDANLFIAEGPTVVERLLRSRFEVQSVLISERKMESFGDRLPADIPIYRLPHSLAQQLVGYSFHSGVMASGVRQTLVSLPVEPEERLSSENRKLILAGDRIVDPENVGALIRIASAFGAAAVIFGPGSADPFSRRVLRVSMGNVLFLPVVETPDLPAELARLTSLNYEVCATILDPLVTPLHEHNFHDHTALVFGNEYDGVSAEVLASCRKRLTIPMLNGTDSLNIAVSAGIFAHAFRAQHYSPVQPSEPGPSR
ncbi:MAG: RNA methyltransferase [Planctomyces sp.]|nr:RNA methyltransferase [Planctomyces sp.]